LILHVLLSIFFISSIKTFAALNGLLCADVPLRKYSLTHAWII